MYVTSIDQSPDIETLCWSPHHRSWLGWSSDAQCSVIGGQGHDQQLVWPRVWSKVWDMWNMFEPFFGGWYYMVSRFVISWISLRFPTFQYPQYQLSSKISPDFATGHRTKCSEKQSATWRARTSAITSWIMTTSPWPWPMKPSAGRKRACFLWKNVTTELGGGWMAVDK